MRGLAYHFRWGNANWQHSAHPYHTLIGFSSATPSGAVSDAYKSRMPQRGEVIKYAQRKTDPCMQDVDNIERKDEHSARTWYFWTDLPGTAEGVILVSHSL